MAKFAILVLSCNLPLYQEFKFAQRESWVKAARLAGIPVYFCEGLGTTWDPNKVHSTPVQFDNLDTLHVDCSDTLQASFLKTLTSMKYIFDNTSADFILRTNLSSYLEISNLLEFSYLFLGGEYSYLGLTGQTRLLPEVLYISGKKEFSYLARKFDIFSQKISFASGACFFISRHFYERVLKSHQLINLIDDVGFGYHLHVKASDIFPLKRFSLSLSDFRNGDLLSKPHLDFYDGLNFHYRCKNGSRHDDVRLIQELGRYFEGV